MTTVQKWIAWAFGITLFMIPTSVLIVVTSQDSPAPAPAITVHQPGKSSQFTDPGWNPEHAPVIPPVGPITAPTPGTDGMGVMA